MPKADYDDLNDHCPRVITLQDTDLDDLSMLSGAHHGYFDRVVCSLDTGNFLLLGVLMVQDRSNRVDQSLRFARYATRGATCGVSHG